MNALAGIALTTFALAVTSTAGASTVTSVQLALMPLPASALGAQASTLPIAQDSGVVTNAQLAANANAPLTGTRLGALGSVSSYQLDYGSPIPAGGRLSDVETAVELYRTAAQAAAGLTFWRADAAATARAQALGITIEVSFFPEGSLGAGGFGDLMAGAISGLPSFHEADVAFRVGRVLATVTIQGSTPATIRALATSDARALRIRMRAVLAGTIAGPPPVLPSAAKPSPPPGGPSLEAIALAPDDFIAATLKSQGYRLDSSLNPIAEYQRLLAPAGALGSFQEQVALFRSPLAAAFTMIVLHHAFASALGLRSSGFNGKGEPTYRPRAVALNIGDPSFAMLGVLHFPSGKQVELGYLVVRVGRTLELTVVGDPTTMKLSLAAIGALADAIATRARAVLHLAAIPSSSGSPLTA